MHRRAPVQVWCVEVACSVSGRNRPLNPTETIYEDVPVMCALLRAASGKKHQNVDAVVGWWLWRPCNLPLMSRADAIPVPPVLQGYELWSSFFKITSLATTWVSIYPSISLVSLRLLRATCSLPDIFTISSLRMYMPTACFSWRNLSTFLFSLRVCA